MAGGGGDSAPAAPIVPLELQIIPEGGEAVASNGIGLLNENADGSTSPVQIGTINDNKNGNEQAYYALPEDGNTANDKFAITGNTGKQVLQFTGTDAGDYEASTRPKYNLKIERYDSEEHYNTRNEEGAKQPQTQDFTVNLKDLATLPINVADDAPFADEDGEGFLDEGVDGSTTPVLLFTLGDGTGTYVLTNHNDRFEITGNQLFYKGTALDFENANDPKKFILNVERTDAGNIQTFDEYVVNTRDVLPTITGNEGATTTALPYLAMGDVGNDYYKMIFGVAAEGDKLTIDFEKGGPGLLGVEAKYVDNDNPSPDTLTGFLVLTRSLNYDTIAAALNDKNSQTGARDIDTQEKQANFQLWYDYVKYVEDMSTLAGSPIGNNPLFSSVVTLTGTERGIVVGADTATTDILANFASADTATFSLGGTDKADFNIDAAGNLRFENAPDYANPADANGDNQYRVTIEADDGVNTETHNLLVVVVPATSINQNTGASASAAEGVVPATDGEATPEAEAAKPSIGRRILDYLFTSREEHAQMQNQQMENMFSDSDLDPITPNDPDML